MTSLFEAAGREALVARIRALRPEQGPQWGTMNSAQMLAHCRVPLESACSDTPMKRSFLGLLLGRLVKNSAVGPKPFKQGLPTDTRFLVETPEGFGEERDALVQALETFGQRGPAPLEGSVHPFFGRLTPEEWDALMVKHLDHHLRQFGV